MKFALIVIIPSFENLMALLIKLIKTYRILSVSDYNTWGIFVS